MAGSARYQLRRCVQLQKTTEERAKNVEHD